MSNKELRFRQIHLDFHTSEMIEDIGIDFDPEEFVSVLKEARVDSINVFARCHHGWLYYQSKKFPERIHPHLKRPNLLQEQIAACHAKGIKAPIYLPIQWDHYTAERHAEWLTMTAEGKQEGTGPYEAGFYRSLCVNSPYIDFIKDHIAEIFELMPVDGFWIDIVQPKDCSCYSCRQRMLDADLDPSNTAVRKQFGIASITRFKLELTKYIRQFSNDCTIFYNAGHIGTRERQAKNAFTHFEIESIAGGCWGYLHFPVTIRYARTLGLDCLGMTGKFQTAWGDFHSFKNPRALEYECFRMLALNAKCCIGDQLHPLGKVCKHTYELIGSVYKQVEQKEPWCRGVTPLVDIAVFNPEESDCREPVEGLWPSILGITRMLQEGSHQFDIIDSQADFGRYKVIILPDDITMSQELAVKVEQYVKTGGAVIASFCSGLDTDKKAFAFKSLGVELVDNGPVDAKGQQARGRWYYAGDFIDYIVPNGQLAKGLAETEYVMYLRGTHIKAVKGTQVLLNCTASYFDRSYQHFCSHLQTPSSGTISQPAAVKNGRVIYFCHPIFTTYEFNAPLWCKKLFLNALEILLPRPLMRHDGPSMINATINEQKSHNRWVLHMLNYVPEMRCKKLEVIEDVIPCYDVAVSVRIDRAVKEVVTAPQLQQLRFTQADGYVQFTVPKIDGHQMVTVGF
jgi:hypothetical protein